MENKKVDVWFGTSSWLGPTLIIISLVVNTPHFLRDSTPAGLLDFLQSWETAGGLLGLLYKCFDGWSAIPFCIFTPLVIGIVGVIVITATGILLYKIFLSKRDPIKW